MKILELFAGSRSIGKAAEELGHEVFSTDIHPFEGIDLVKDVLEIEPNDIPFIPDMIWASPPCTGFSVAAIGHHWTGGKGAYIPKTNTARLGIQLVEKTFELINFYSDMNSCMEWFVENPRGLLRKMPITDRYHRHTVTYCQYGDNRMKPTDIWTNSLEWTPKPMCKNGATCHVAAPRGSRTGTQGLKGNYERSKIPHELCLEVVRAAETGHLLPF